MTWDDMLTDRGPPSESYQDRMNRRRLEGELPVNLTAPERQFTDQPSNCEIDDCFHADDNLPLLLSELLDPDFISQFFPNG